jgi:hypothetical protein
VIQQYVASGMQLTKLIIPKSATPRRRKRKSRSKTKTTIKSKSRIKSKIQFLDSR